MAEPTAVRDSNHHSNQDNGELDPVDHGLSGLLFFCCGQFAVLEGIRTFGEAQSVAGGGLHRIAHDGFHRVFVSSGAKFFCNT